MSTIRNPYYAGTRPATGGYVDSGIGNLFQDVVNFAQLSQAGTRNEANEAAARLSNAKAIAEMDKVNALRTPPETLAKLFLSGGKMDADTAQLKPGWENQMDSATAPRDYSLAAPVQSPNAISSIFTGSGMSPNEQMGRAFQEALARGIKVDDIAKMFAQGGYLNHVNNGTPDEGMGYLPLFGALPNKNTALSVDRQNQLQRIDSDRAFGVAGIHAASALAVEKQRGQNQRDLADHKVPIDQEMEKLRQEGRIALATHKFELKENGTVTSTKPSATPNVPPSTIKSIRESVIARAKDVKYLDGDKETNIELDNNATDAIVVEVTRRMQDPKLDGAGYKNPALALDTVMEDLINGQMANLKYNNVGSPWYKFGMGTPTTQVTRAKSAPAAAPTIQQPQPSGSTKPLRSDPASLENARRAIKSGADKNAVIKRLKDSGIDPTGL